VALDPLGSSPRQPGNKLLQYHLVDDVIGVASFGQQPFAARVPELLRQDKGSAGFSQFQ
jgi:hypothetical protein